MANEGLKVPILVKATGEIIYVSPGIKAGKLKHFPNDYEDAQEIIFEKITPETEIPSEEVPDDAPEVDAQPETDAEPETMNVTQLRAYAKSNGMKNTARKNREQLLEFINNL